jgi:hypothetical protein
MGVGGPLPASAHHPALLAQRNGLRPTQRYVEDMGMHIDGGCHCGSITYDADIDPDTVGICHCTDCQVLSGSAYVVSVPAAREAFRLRTGQPKIYVKTAESGTKRAQAFCPECGTRIYASAVHDPPVFNIRIGTVRQRAALQPHRQIWCQSALPWVMDLGSVPQIAGQPPR